MVEKKRFNFWKIFRPFLIDIWVYGLIIICAGVQVLYGDLEEAICHHAVYYSIWRKYGCLPERYNWKLDAPDVKFYPLR